MKISWSRDDRAKSSASGMALFGVGYEGEKYFGSIGGSMNEDHASKLFAFARELSKTKDPLAAFQTVFGPIETTVEIINDGK